MKTISHQNFVNEYNAGKLQILVNEYKAGDLVLSPYADKHRKPAHLFWTWLGIILLAPVPIALLFTIGIIPWLYSFLE